MIMVRHIPLLLWNALRFLIPLLYCPPCNTMFLLKYKKNFDPNPSRSPFVANLRISLPLENSISFPWIRAAYLHVRDSSMVATLPNVCFGSSETTMHSIEISWTIGTMIILTRTLPQWSNPIRNPTANSIIESS